jgi:hypothetical protein
VEYLRVWASVELVCVRVWMDADIICVRATVLTGKRGSTYVHSSRVVGCVVMMSCVKSKCRRQGCLFKLLVLRQISMFPTLKILSDLLNGF